MQEDTTVKTTEQEYDPTPPISSTEDYVEVYGHEPGDEESEPCPACKSKKVRVTQFIDNHKIILEFECLTCGATWDTR